MKKTKQEELVIEKPIDIINKYYKLFLTCGSALCIIILYIIAYFYRNLYFYFFPHLPYGFLLDFYQHI